MSKWWGLVAVGGAAFTGACFVGAPAPIIGASVIAPPVLLLITYVLWHQLLLREERTVWVPIWIGVVGPVVATTAMSVLVTLGAATDDILLAVGWPEAIRAIRGMIVGFPTVLAFVLFYGGAIGPLVICVFLFPAIAYVIAEFPDQAKSQ